MTKVKKKSLTKLNVKIFKFFWMNLINLIKFKIKNIHKELVKISP